MFAFRAPAITRTLLPCTPRQLLPPAEFRAALGWERQRSERSGLPLLVAVLHLEGEGWRREPAALTAFCGGLIRVARTTDTLGWLEEGTSIGILFTDPRVAFAEGPLQAISRKIEEFVQAEVPKQPAFQLRISYHAFPDAERTGGGPDPLFHDDGKPQARRAARILKRSIDLAGGSLLLAMLAPLILLIAASIRFTSKGPALCRQTRVGEGGRTFTLLKFRSMYHDNDPSLHREYVRRLIAGESVAGDGAGAAPVYKIVNDPRVTPVGRFLRRSSLDELPQLFNVLQGTMSLVGPRPPLPYEFERYRPWHRRRLMEAKPGMTGLWQVEGRSRTTFDEMVRLDLQYARQWSVWLDLKILLKTPLAVVAGDGAY